MGIGRILRNELLTLLWQGGRHEDLFRAEINGHLPGAPADEPARGYFDQWQLPPLGFRNYWYPVTLSSELQRRPFRRRLLGEDIVFWRDGDKVGALADRCPHRGASLSMGHVRFPGSGTLSCPYHGWTFDGQGQLQACIQEGPDSKMPGKVQTKAYPVEERLGVVWVWIGDMSPVPIEEDLPVAMKVPGVVNFIHFTKVWKTNWALLFDNFADGLHAPYVHRSSPQFLLHKLAYRTLGAEPYLDAIEHDGKVLEMPRFKSAGPPKDQVEFPELGTFPRHKWWRIMPSRRNPNASFVPGFRPNSFLHGLPSYVHTVHEDQYFTQFIIPIDRDHLYNMCAMTGRHTPASRLRWSLQFQLFRVTHDRMFIGQDHRVLRQAKLGPERLSAWDQDVIRWRKFAVQNARRPAALPSKAATEAWPVPSEAHEAKLFPISPIV
ncbi:MAG TPA: aromatic ring-hydroxylating dioxygenase subunit alpha [Chloroflexota bacterium]|nr:aromatic ring-hydroxylating dioxygenase subunit alpha [Chloroflexota bacterium]